MEQEEILSELLDAGERSGKPEGISTRQVQCYSFTRILRCGTLRKHTS